MDANSLPNPAKKNGKFLDPRFDTWKNVHICFKNQLLIYVGSQMCELMNLSTLSLPTFKRILNEKFENIKLAKTISACCNTCVKLDSLISQKTGEQRKEEEIKKTNHIKYTQIERGYYSDRIKWLRDQNNRLVMTEQYRTYKNNVLHLSIDAMQNKSYPTFTGYNEPSWFYFTKKIILHLLGVIDEGANEGVVYVYDQRIGATNANHIISTLNDVIEHQLGSRRFLWINVDNCAVNKNRWVSRKV